MSIVYVCAAGAPRAEGGAWAAASSVYGTRVLHAAAQKQRQEARPQTVNWPITKPSERLSLAINGYSVVARQVPVAAVHHLKQHLWHVRCRKRHPIYPHPRRIQREDIIRPQVRYQAHLG